MQAEDGAMRVCRASACENGHSAFLATHDFDEPDSPALHSWSAGGSVSGRCLCWRGA